jgi:hypothetical protein
MTRPIIAFSKPFQTLSAGDTASLIEETGYQGIECPVRGEGQVEPERVEEDLPRLCGGLPAAQPRHPGHRHGDLTPFARRTPRECCVPPRSSGIGKDPPGHLQVRRLTAPSNEQLDDFGKALGDIGEACRELGIQAALQNHSGSGPFWRPGLGFRGRHADAPDQERRHVLRHRARPRRRRPVVAHPGKRLAEPYYAAVYVKDFTWRKGPEGWRPACCPLGEGMVNGSFFAGLSRSGFPGPICLHHEYPLGDHGQMVTHMRRDLRVLREWLA